MEELVKEYKFEVLEEFFDHLNRLEIILGDVNSSEDFLNQYREIFRIIHSMKGGASSADFDSLASNLHNLEAILQEFQSGNLKFNKGVHETFVQAIDFLFEGADKIKKDLNTDFSFDKLSEIVESLKKCGLNDDQVGSKRVLIIDDNEDVLETLGTMVEDLLDCSIETKQDSLSAFGNINTESYDIIITDYEMPGMNGTDLIEKVRQSNGVNHSTPIVLVTGHRPIYNPDQKTWENVFFLDKATELMRLDFILKCCLRPKKSA